MNENLGFSGILKNSLKILYNNPKFIIFTFLTSLPLFSSLLIHEIFLQRALITTTNIISEELQNSINFGALLDIFEILRQEEVFQRFLILGLSYLGIIHVLDVINAITTVDRASWIYTGGEPMTLIEMLKLHKPTNKSLSFKGPFITSLYAILLGSYMLFAMVYLVAQFSLVYTTQRSIPFAPFREHLFRVLFLGLFLSLLIRCMQWSAVCNMGFVISILQAKRGIIAIGVAAYFSKSCKMRGLVFMLFYFVSGLGLRLLCLRWYEGRLGVVVSCLHVGLVCLGKVMKWLVFLVYFYDCKGRTLQKKIDVEVGATFQQIM